MTTTASPLRGAVDTSPGAIFHLVRSGLAASRRDIARWSGLAPSTVSLRVESLVRAGLLQESGAPGRRTGRTPRTLQVRADGPLVASVVLGPSGAELVLADLRGRTRATDRIDIDVGRGPDAVLPELRSHAGRVAGTVADSAGELAGWAVGLPAPVDAERRTVSASAQLPGWERADLVALMGHSTPTPTILENDANLLAVAEHEHTPAPVRHLIAVKLGERIGAGIVAADRLFTGARGAAGEIGHSATGAPSVIGCACAVPGCLESVASGRALVTRLQRDGHDVGSVADLAAAAGAEDPHAVAALRTAGGLVGERLAEFVNFFNPELVVLGGGLAEVGVYVGAVRAEMFRACLPIVAGSVELTVSRVGRSAEAVGGVRLILDRILGVGAVNELVSASDG
ncbi:ROK family transcriptional regulator [Pseudonocardia sp. HH130630-07]|uniref:ROK family transcriptional regulator n=1 Tax=Pseudonocardia sp. HH130630-07 TaxID=1690815 RepID=UPI00081506E5|nr:ROK family protein [Pseudonocardia sp. HH130630-07]ANY08942.1 hypothetical protein AFB00_24760 [Pseudonocardia sp. HH130630-07]